MTDRATATAWIHDVAAGRWDAALAERGGFTRTASASTYTRKVSDGRQRIHLDLIVRPPYGPDSFHLAPRLSIAFPEMAKIGAWLLGQNLPGFGKSGTVEIVPLELIAPDVPMFLFVSAEQLDELAPEIERFLVDAAVPYLDERTSVATLTAAKERAWAVSGAEAGGRGHVPVVVAAGHLTMGDARRALQTLDTAYPSGTLGRKDYADAISIAEASAHGAIIERGDRDRT